MTEERQEQFKVLCAVWVDHLGRLISYYNNFWLEAQHPAGLLSISCLSYNKGSNWLTIASLGFHVRAKDCQPSPYCSVRFEQVEPWSSRHSID